jgi:hypothetical protein
MKRSTRSELADWCLLAIVPGIIGTPLEWWSIPCALGIAVVGWLLVDVRAYRRDLRFQSRWNAKRWPT